MNCIAIDDEPLALNVIKEFCEKTGFLNLIGTFNNPFDALKLFREHQVDFLFLDIQMPNISGIEFYKSLTNPPMVIFTTAYSEHAHTGFDVNAVDYLVKPFSFERFVRAINKVYELKSLRKEIQIHSNSGLAEFIMVKVEYNTVRIDLKDILFIEGLKDYVKMFYGAKHLLTKSTLKNIEEKLPEERFCRVHKSYIISFEKIERIENNRIIIGEHRIPVGDQYRALFYNRLKNKTL
jgi:DNA-binding LytR/AlgR family response regulator